MTGSSCSAPSVLIVPVSSRKCRPLRRDELQESGGEHAQHVTVRDQRDVSVAEQRHDPGEHPVGSLADLFHGLAGMFGVSGDDAVPPQVPAGMLFPNLGRGHALVAAVIPFPQIGVQLRVRQARQGRGHDRAPGRTGEGRYDMSPGQQGGQCRGGSLAAPGERDICPPGVPALQAPLGLAVPEQDQISHGSLTYR